MGVIDKPLNEWTLGEVKTYCCEHEDCNECGFHSSGRCDLRNVPSSWNMLQRAYKPKGTQALLDTSKPRLAEVLSVEVRQKFKIAGFECIGECWIDEDGFIINNGNTLVPAAVLARIINAPELIVCTQCLTNPELAICKASGAKWVSRDSYEYSDDLVVLWSEKPEKGAKGFYSAKRAVAWYDVKAFPSVRPGDLIEVPERGITNA